MGLSERVNRQSAAEFFAEHQQIAGFDNAGKSLYTTIREFVENSLDAAESISELPDVAVTVREYTESEHNALHGIRQQGKGAKKAATAPAPDHPEAGNDGDDGLEDTPVPSPVPASKGKKREKGDPKELSYYEVSCKDNGCGIAEKNIGDMLGRVLSGSKQGLRQTRGKFGLGAKMALIWSKKSSGLPIKIRTAHSSTKEKVASRIVTVVLDIDIHKNEPRILSKTYDDNEDNWRGTEISVTICGNWSAYRSRCLQYFQQLAVITPYARLQLNYHSHQNAGKDFEAVFVRRSDKMPPPTKEVSPHPKALNIITLTNLLQESKWSTVNKCLSADLNCVTGPLAKKICERLDIAGKHPERLSSKEIAALRQELRDEKGIKQPTAACLSPAGEYNMRLGVFKELRPKMVATFTDKPGAYEGHAFLVEAAVSVGGEKLREGINVYRFANRIPLLFEGGGDVCTKCATELNWRSYHIDKNTQSIGVFVSIVSTRIPFKGTSKEYIGDDNKEIKASVKRAIEGCCRQLRSNLVATMAKAEVEERKKSLTQYIPDISRALSSVVNKMVEKRGIGQLVGSPSSGAVKRGRSASTDAIRADAVMLELAVEKGKRRKLADMATTLKEMLERAVDQLERKSIMESSALEASMKRVKAFLVPQTTLLHAPDPNTGLPPANNDDCGGSASTAPAAREVRGEWVTVRSTGGLGVQVLITDPKILAAIHSSVPAMQNAMLKTTSPPPAGGGGACGLGGASASSPQSASSVASTPIRPAKGTGKSAAVITADAALDAALTPVSDKSPSPSRSRSRSRTPRRMTTPGSIAASTGTVISTPPTSTILMDLSEAT